MTRFTIALLRFMVLVLGKFPRLARHRIRLQKHVFYMDYKLWPRGTLIQITRDTFVLGTKLVKGTRLVVVTKFPHEKTTDDAWLCKNENGFWNLLEWQLKENTRTL